MILQPGEAHEGEGQNWCLPALRGGKTVRDNNVHCRTRFWRSGHPSCAGDYLCVVWDGLECGDVAARLEVLVNDAREKRLQVEVMSLA
jgi:hypothetical protein